jgi:quinol monooxygenase YgiN
MPQRVYQVEFTVSGASDKEVDEVVKEMVAAAEAEEPGTLVYAWFRAQDDPKRFRVIEVYEDEAAQERHLKGPLMRKAARRLQPFMDAGGTGSAFVRVAAKGLA